MKKHTTPGTGSAETEAAASHTRPEDIHPEVPLFDLSRDPTHDEIDAFLAAHPRTILHLGYPRMINFNAAITYGQLAEAYAAITPEPLQPAHFTFRQAISAYLDAVRQPAGSILTHDLQAPLNERVRLRNALANDVSIAAASADDATADAARRADLIIRRYRTDSRAIPTETLSIRETARALTAAAFAQYLDLLPVSKAILPRLAAANEQANRVYEQRLIELDARTAGLTRTLRVAADAAAAALADDINAYLRFNTFPGFEAIVRAANRAIVEAIHTMRRRAAHHHRHPAEGGEAAAQEVNN